MLHAFALAFRQLGDRRMIAIFAKSLAITLVVFAGLGVGLYFLLERLTARLVGPHSSALVVTLAFAMGLALFWLTFRAVAVAVIGLFADEVVAVVEGRSYPRALASARHVSFARSAAMGLRSVGRLVAFNTLAVPLYVAAAATGIGLPIAFFAVNAWLLGRDLGDMVAVRHLDPAQLKDWRARTRTQRFLAGLAASGLFVVPGVNLVAPVVGAAAMTHLFHRANLFRGREA